jgi:hypothetical protein
MWTFESVKTNSVVKWVVWVLGVIVLGALGSGFWEIVLKPAFVHASYGLMTLSSLGIESVRTGIYEGIATGSTSRAGVQTLNLVTLLTVALSALVFNYFLIHYVESQRERKRLDGSAEQRKSPEELIQQLRKLLKFQRGLLYWLGFWILLMSGMLLVDLSRVFYENAAVVHFQQALKIAAPYLSDTDRATVESRFAQIHSKSEYVAIVDGLARTATEHGQQVPAFNAW